jgi:hypothetical protein
MRVSLRLLNRVPSKSGAAALAALTLIAAATPAGAQYVQIQGVEIAPFIGTRFGGSFDIQTEDIAQPKSTVQTRAALDDAKSLGMSGGVRFDDYSLIEFRYTRSDTSMNFGSALSFEGFPRLELTVNQFHAVFTREFPIREVKGLRSFLAGSVGATYISAANDGFTRFSGGLGTGLTQSLGSRLAIRAEAHWLPILIEPEVSGFACGTVNLGGCLVVLNGRVTQQFELAIGPVVRF